MSGRRTDRDALLSLVERAAAELVVDPSLKANEIHRRIGGRRGDVLRAVKALTSVMADRRSG
jgi:hypothetical protein